MRGTLQDLREEQDDYAVASYKRAIETQEKCHFSAEIAPVEISSKKGR